MLKRILLVFICTSLLVLSGCSEGSLTDLVASLKDAGNSLLEPDANKAEVRPAALTTASLEILELLDGSFDQDIRLIDFTAPAEARRLVITQWALENNKWLAQEDDTIGLSGGESGRIVLAYETLIEGANIAVSMGGAIYSCSHEGMTEAAVTTPLERLTAYLTMPTTIALEAEIPLLYQIQSNGTGVSAVPLETWQDTEQFSQYVNVALVTVRFSTEPMEAAPTPQP